VRRACAAARQAGGTQTGNLIFVQKKPRNCPPVCAVRAGQLRD